MTDFLPDIPASPVLKKPIWQALSVRDTIYVAVLGFMLLNQHFNQESRLEKLEAEQVQMVDTMSAIQKKMTAEMVPRDEIDADRVAVSARLTNIETGQNNIMTYLLNQGR